MSILINSEAEYQHPRTSTLKLRHAGYDPKTVLENYKRSKRRYKRGETEKQPHWIRQFVHPVAVAICKLAGYDGCEISHSAMGLCCRVGVYFIKGRQRVFWIAFNSPNLDKGTICVTDYTKDNGEYSSGSIGYRNGMHHPSITIETDEMTAPDILQHGCPVDLADNDDSLGGTSGQLHWINRP